MLEIKVTLYIPCFNAENTIRECLEGVFNQALVPDEILVIDDGSTDKTIEIVRKYPVKIISHVENRGLAAARNSAIENAQGEFIASLDTDCIADPEWLSRMIARLGAQDIAGVGGRLVEKYSDSVFDRWRSVHMKQEWKDEKSSPDFLFGSNTVFRKQAITDAGLYNEVFKTNYEDVDMCRRLKNAGWALVYEPKALVHHLKRDNISSLLNAYWRWHTFFYKEKEFYASHENFINKIKDSLGLANRYIHEDIKSGREDLVYLDFLLSLHHCLRDFEYFTFKDKHKYPDYSRLSFWLSLVDLTFFYHFESEKKDLSTLMPEANIFLQNYLALSLMIEKVVSDRFKDEDFRRRLCKDLLCSVHKINDNALSDKLFNLSYFHPDWRGFIHKKHPHLDVLFLKNMLRYFDSWLSNLLADFPEIIKILGRSAKNTKDSLQVNRKES